MNIPENFKNKIESIFYDKTFTRCEVTVVKDATGWTRYSEPVTVGTFKGSINYSKLNEVQEKYGIHTEIEATIHTNENIALGEIVSYNGTYLKVVKAVPFDSHNLLIVQKWSSTSSTLTSA